MRSLLLLLALATAACAGDVTLAGPDRPDVTHIPGPDDVHDEPQRM